MANLQELKKLMDSVPDHKMHHDKPMHGPIKKHEVAGKMSANLEALRAKKKADMQKPIQNEKRNDMVHKVRSMAEQQHQHTENHEFQRRTGRAWND